MTVQKGIAMDLARDYCLKLADMTPGEARYFETRGVEVELFARENGLSVMSSGTLGCVTIDGRVVDRDKYANGFCLGDIVYLRAGSVPMLVEGAKTVSKFRHVACMWMQDGKMQRDSFEPECLTRDIAVLEYSPLPSALIERLKQDAAKPARRINAWVWAAAAAALVLAAAGAMAALKTMPTF
jgi:uncharacterized protein YodC (DUF2158 family)